MGEWRGASLARKKRGLAGTLRLYTKHWQFYLIILLPVVYIIVFSYIPMHGVLYAFQDYSPRKGVLGSPWVGLKHFQQFFASPSCLRIIYNTFILGLYGLIASFPFPIILAVALNEIGNRPYKKMVQMVTYAPYFISTVVLVGMLMQVTDERLGVINNIISLTGGERINFMGRPSMFRSLYVWSGVWQSMGYNSIIYIAALTAVDLQIQEAAIIDGASRVQRIWHVDLPAIRPQITILLIFSIGRIVNVGYEKVYLMQNALNLSVSEVISTYVYKVGLVNADYSFSTAVGLFNSLVNILLLLIANGIAKKVTETSLF